MFWGDRYGAVTDPFGHNWSFATHVEEPSERALGDDDTSSGGFAAVAVARLWSRACLG
jgi:hypothetical protein